jgi:alpha-beta hydrolase superfamily lysophospholipase
MKTHNLSFPSHDEQTTIRAWLKEPDKVASGKQLPRAIIQILHGVAEHSSRYESIAKILVDKGFVVCAHDHIGHGRSLANPEDLGHMPAKGSVKTLVEDTHSLRSYVQPRYLESVPYIIIGHSMGSYILRVYLAEYARGLSAAVIVGTSQPSLMSAAFVNLIARGISLRSGERVCSRRLHYLGLGSYARKIKHRRTEYDWICTDPAVVDAYIADPLCGFRITNGAYVTLTQLMKEMVGNKVINKPLKGLNILCISGSQDPLGNRGRAAKALSQQYKQASVEHADSWVYPNMRHEVLNEPDRKKTLNDLVDWLELRLGV